MVAAAEPAAAAAPGAAAPTAARRGAALTFAELGASARMPALDGLRAVAVLLVITWHVRGGALAALNGDTGVTVFFVLSGFLITTLALREEQRRGRFGYPAFLVRRAFRILPLLWLGVAVYAVAVLVLHLDPRAAAFARAVPYQLFYLPEVPVFTAPPALDVGEGPVPFAGTWSLGIEEKFYLVWPLVAFVLLAGRRRRGLLALVLAVGLWVFTALAPHEPAKFLGSYAPLLLGCVVAMVLAQPRGHGVLVRLTRPAVAVPALLLAVGLNLVRWDRHGWWAQPGHVAVQLLVALLLVAVVLRPTSLGGRALSGRAVAHVGVLSYAIYLFHSLALKVVDRVLPAGGGLPMALVSLVLGVALAVAGCEVLHRVVERPGQRLGRRLASRLERRPQPAVGSVDTVDVTDVTDVGAPSDLTPRAARAAS